MISFNCDKCGQALDADDSLAGSTADCPSCSSAVLIPEARSAPSLRPAAPIRPPRPPDRAAELALLQSIADSTRKIWTAVAFFVIVAILGLILQVLLIR
jgi:DNA-directed RNA polymerase subunit RPC12/RpoP